MQVNITDQVDEIVVEGQVQDNDGITTRKMKGILYRSAISSVKPTIWVQCIGDFKGNSMPIAAV